MIYERVRWTVKAIIERRNSASARNVSDFYSSPSPFCSRYVTDDGTPERNRYQ